MKETNFKSQDFIPVQEISHGLIITTDKRYLKVLEIEPINFMLRNVEEQEDIIQNFAGWLKVSPVSFQIKVITHAADANKYIETLQQYLDKEENENCIELGYHYKNLIYSVGSHGAVTRRFFLIFEYEPYGMRKTEEITEIEYEMNQIASKIKSYFAKTGNEIILYQDEDYFLGEFLYLYYNRGSQISESFSQRIERVIEDSKTVHGLTDSIPDIPFTDLIAPRGIDFTNSKYVIIDGIYQSHLYITSKGYPTKVAGGWLSMLVTLGNKIDVDIFARKEERSIFLTKVSRKIRLTRLKAQDRDDTQSDFEEIQSSIDSGLYIKKAISQNNEDPFYMNIFITISATTIEELVWKKEQVMDFITSQDMTVMECTYHEEAAFNSVSPFLKLDKKLFNKSKRNVLTQGLASCYPFTAFEMCDEDGIMLGVNKHNSSLCVVDLFDAKKYKNANMAILGTSGAGKTFAEQLIALRMRMLDTQCFILSPDKSHEFKRACDAIGGSYIKISPSSKDCINIMEIRPTSSPVQELLDGYSIETETWLSKKVQQLITFFQLLIEDLTNEEEQLLDEAIMKTYQKKGFTDDNDSFYVDPKDKSKGMKEMPILGDLYNMLLEDSERIPKRLPNIISKFVTGSAQSFNNQTNVDLNNKYIVFDLQDLKGRILPCGMFIALDFVWDKIKEDRTKKKAVFIDEAWQLIGSGANIKAAEFVHHIFKVIRGYGGGAILATQDILDLFSLEDGKYGAAILSCSKIKMVLNLEEDEAKRVKEILKLTRKEIRDIVNYERGQALVCANNNHIPVSVIASGYETTLITTDRSQTEQLLRNLLNKNQTQSDIQAPIKEKDLRQETSKEV